jgi:transcriptional regulator with XRE-family HTH domain
MAQAPTRRSRLRSGGGPHPIDVRVGARIRERRAVLGLTQDQLATAIGVTFQQVQKYERAANRISASRLYYMSKVLGVDVPYFYEEYEESGAPSGFAESPAATFESDLLQRPEAIELVEAFYRIENPTLRRQMLALAKSFAAGGEPK